MMRPSTCAWKSASVCRSLATVGPGPMALTRTFGASAWAALIYFVVGGVAGGVDPTPPALPAPPSAPRGRAPRARGGGLGGEGARNAVGGGFCAARRAAAPSPAGDERCLAQILHSEF